MCVLITRITIIILYKNYNSHNYSLLFASSTATTRALRRRAWHSTQRRAHVWTSKIKSLCACMSSSSAGSSRPHHSRRDCPAHLVHDSGSVAISMISHHAKDSQHQGIRWRFPPFLSLQHTIPALILSIVFSPSNGPAHPKPVVAIAFFLRESRSAHQVPPVTIQPSKVFVAWIHDHFEMLNRFKDGDDFKLSRYGFKRCRL